MKKRQIALLAVLAAALVCISGCRSAAVSGTVESKEIDSVSSSSLARNTVPDSERNASPGNNASAGTVPFSEDATMPSGESASAVSTASDSTVMPIPSQESASASDVTPAPQAMTTPSAESASAMNSTADSAVTPIPSDETVTAASPTPSPAAKAASDFIYPIQSFADKTRICLTFDDGGDRKSVRKALEILKKHEVKCTFFVVGNYMKADEALWKQAAEEGHIICNHTQSHKWLAELSSEDVKKEILEWESTVVKILGQEYLDKMKQEFPFIRLPGGSGNESKRVLRIVNELGYIPVGWNLETYYAVLRHHNLSTEPLNPIAEEVFAHVTKRVKGGSIVLLHFNPYDTARLDEIITSIKEKNLTMHLLQECLNY